MSGWLNLWKFVCFIIIFIKIAISTHFNDQLHHHDCVHTQSNADNYTWSEYTFRSVCGSSALYICIWIDRPIHRSIDRTIDSVQQTWSMTKRRKTAERGLINEDRSYMMMMFICIHLVVYKNMRSLPPFPFASGGESDHRHTAAAAALFIRPF